MHTKELENQPEYIHAEFPGNPRKNGIINVSEALSLPIKLRAKKARETA